MVNFAELDNSLINDALVKGFKYTKTKKVNPLDFSHHDDEQKPCTKSAAEIAKETFEKNEREEEAQEFRRESSLKANKERYGERINDLFADFDRHLSADFGKYSNPELKTNLNETKDNIRLFADDMHKPSELAGGDPKLEKQAEKITANLLDRLKNDGLN